MVPRWNARERRISGAIESKLGERMNGTTKRIAAIGALLAAAAMGAHAQRSISIEAAKSERFLCIEISKAKDGKETRSEPRQAWISSTGLATCGYEDLPPSGTFETIVTTVAGWPED